MARQKTQLSAKTGVAAKNRGDWLSQKPESLLGEGNYSGEFRRTLIKGALIDKKRRKSG